MLKRAVSPLIATVLLVMIVVSIGAAVMVVIQGLSDEQLDVIAQGQEALKCNSEIKVEILQVGSTNRLCLNNENTTFSFYVQNTGTKDIVNWDLLVIGDSVEFLENQGTLFSRGNVSGYTISFTEVNNIQKITLYPKIPGSAGNRNIPCSLSTLEWEAEDINDFQSCNETSWDDN